MDSQKINKIIGYVLLVAGLLLIVVPLYQTYQIFTGNSLPPAVFRPTPVAPPTQTNNPFDIGQQVEKAVQNVLPIQAIDNTLNLFSWLILMWILLSGGGKLADIGIKLVNDHGK